MTNNHKIDDFEYWRIPSGEGVLYLEGKASEEERTLNRQRTAERRKLWEPSPIGLSIYRQLKYLEGNHLIIQLWNDMMEMLPDEGTLPFSCEVVKVFTKSIKEEDRDFVQLFIEFKNPKPIDNGNLGGSPIYERHFNPKSGTYTYNCSVFAWVQEDLEPVLSNVCAFIADWETQIFEKLDFESVSVYQFLQEEFQKGDITSNYVFQFLFRSFYRLDNAGLTEEFKTEFFKILEELRNTKELDIWSIDDRLAKIKDRQGRTPVQFSFITKLLNTLHNDYPIYDGEVAKMFGFKRPDYLKQRDERLEEYSYQHSKVFSIYQLIIEKDMLKSAIQLFETKFPESNISQTKMLDFIFWQAGKLKSS